MGVIFSLLTEELPKGTAHRHQHQRHEYTDSWKMTKCHRKSLMTSLMTNVTGNLWWLIKYGSGNGLSLLGNKPLALSLWEDELASNKETNRLMTSWTLSYGLIAVMQYVHNVAYANDGTCIPLSLKSQHGSCWSPGAYLAPGHMQPSWWQLAARCVSGVLQHEFENDLSKITAASLGANVSYHYMHVVLIKETYV